MIMGPAPGAVNDVDNAPRFFFDGTVMRIAVMIGVMLVAPGQAIPRKKGTAVLVDESGRVYEIEGRSSPAPDLPRFQLPTLEAKGTMEEQKKLAYELLLAPVALAFAAVLWLRRRFFDR
jgi:hypothetical protein